jgi:hypothetical protein
MVLVGRWYRMIRAGLELLVLVDLLEKLEPPALLERQMEPLELLEPPARLEPPVQQGPLAKLLTLDLLELLELLEKPGPPEKLVKRVPLARLAEKPRSL